MHLLGLLQLAFTVWMLVDAIKRGAPWYWFLIILMPIGAVAYFFVVKIHDFTPAARRLLERPASLAALEHLAAQTPSIDNKIRLAQALHDRGKYERARDLFAEVLERAASDREALYGYGSCCLETGRRDAARDALERLVEAEFSFRDHRAVYDLGRIYWEDDRRDEAVELLQRAARGTLLEPRVRLARCLVEMGREDEARTLLADGLQEYRHSPGFVRRRDRYWASKARRLLRQIG